MVRESMSNEVQILNAGFMKQKSSNASMLLFDIPVSNRRFPSQAKAK
jgi:hypothetical protein